MGVLSGTSERAFTYLEKNEDFVGLCHPFPNGHIHGH